MSGRNGLLPSLNILPITKGILRGKRMGLLPHQREFVERVYARRACGSPIVRSPAATARRD